VTGQLVKRVEGSAVVHPSQCVSEWFGRTRVFDRARSRIPIFAGFARATTARARSRSS